MKTIIGVFVFLFSAIAIAKPSIDKLSISYLELRAGSSISLFQPHDIIPSRKLGLDLGINFTENCYLTSNLYGFMDRSPERRLWGQFRSVSWEVATGYHLLSWLSFELVHSSEHLLDAKSQYVYPSYDGVGLRLDLVK